MILFIVQKIQKNAKIMHFCTFLTGFIFPINCISSCSTEGHNECLSTLTQIFSHFHPIVRTCNPFGANSFVNKDNEKHSSRVNEYPKFKRFSEVRGLFIPMVIQNSNISKFKAMEVRYFFFAVIV